MRITKTILAAAMAVSLIRGVPASSDFDEYSAFVPAETDAQPKGYSGYPGDTDTGIAEADYLYADAGDAGTDYTYTNSGDAGTDYTYTDAGDAGTDYTYTDSGDAGADYTYADAGTNDSYTDSGADPEYSVTEFDAAVSSWPEIPAEEHTSFDGTVSPASDGSDFADGDSGSPEETPADGMQWNEFPELSGEAGDYGAVTDSGSSESSGTNAADSMSEFSADTGQVSESALASSPVSVTDAFASAADIAEGASVSVSLKAKGEKKYYCFRPTETNSYSFLSSKNGGCDPAARLYTKNGSQIAESDDCGDDWNFSLTAVLGAGKTYYLEVYEENGKSASFTVSLSGAAFYALPAGSTERYVTPGQKLTLSVNAGSPRGISCQWYLAGTGKKIAGETSLSYTFTPARSGDYICRVTDGKETEEIWFSVKLVNHLKAVPSGKSSFRLKYGAKQTLRVAASAEDMKGVAYSWQDVDGNTLKGKTGDSLTVTAKDNTVYTCTVSDRYGNQKQVYFVISCILTRQTISVKAARVLLTAGEKTTVSVTGARTKVTYSSSDPAAAAISQSGVIKAKRAGFVTMTVTAVQENGYAEDQKSFSIKVLPGVTSSLTVKNRITGIKVLWKKVAGASGYDLYRNNTKIATVSAGNTDVLEYLDTTAAVNGKRYEYKVTAFAKTGRSTLSRKAEIYRLPFVKFSAWASKTKGTVGLQWARNSKAAGYQYEYSGSADFKTSNVVTISSGKVTTGKITGLKSKSTCYVRIRSWLKVNGKYYFSRWSDPKKVLVK